MGASDYFNDPFRNVRWGQARFTKKVRTSTWAATPAITGGGGGGAVFLVCAPVPLGTVPWRNHSTGAPTTD